MTTHLVPKENEAVSQNAKHETFAPTRVVLALILMAPHGKTSLHIQEANLLTDGFRARLMAIGNVKINAEKLAVGQLKKTKLHLQAKNIGHPWLSNS